MNYSEARIFMESRLSGIHLGLDRIEALLETLGNPEKDLKFIHIAGTNGKGSVLSYTSTTLTHAGYKVGRYLSPTLYDYLERFQINGSYMDEATYISLAEQIREAVEANEAKGISCPSAFELETVMCFLYFKQEHCDYVVLECGMGGETDATNVIPSPEVAVLVSISLDHQDFLGSTIGEIAYTKGGIIKPGCTCVTGLQREEALESIQKRCQAAGVTLVQAHPEEAETVYDTLEGQRYFYRGKTIDITLPGSVQKENALTAWTVLQVLRDRGAALTDEQIYEGLKMTRWNGRFTCIGKEPYFFVDGAHNPAAAEKLAESMKTYFAGKDVYCILGIFKDKDYRTIIGLTAPLAKHIFAIETPDNPRALPAAELAEEVAKVNPSVEVCADLQDAVGKAFAQAGKEDVILSFGSLSNIGELTELVKARG